MAFTQIPIFQGQLSAVPSTVLATVPGAVGWIVSDIEICNTDTVAWTFTLTMPGSGAAHAIFWLCSINPGETIVWDAHVVLTTGQTICGGADVAAKVTVTISGAQG